jgi:hypothetical protein
MPSQPPTAMKLGRAFGPATSAYAFLNASFSGDLCATE